eukprot:scaffold76978_cov37-Prasinocladus_malaysianus.AAC.2
MVTILDRWRTLSDFIVALPTAFLESLLEAVTPLAASPSPDGTIKSIHRPAEFQCCSLTVSLLPDNESSKKNRSLKGRLI